MTLLSPIHRLGSELFSAHMTQHELLMLIAAPLLVFGRLGVVMIWAMPARIRRKLAAFAKVRPVTATWAAISAPAAAWFIHGATTWRWHLPALYQATLESEAVHAAQHSTFLFTALLFWWTLIHGRSGRMSYGAAVTYIFTTGVHTSVLGALLTCSQQLWYPLSGVNAYGGGPTGGPVTTNSGYDPNLHLSIVSPQEQRKFETITMPGRLSLAKDP